MHGLHVWPFTERRADTHDVVPVVQVLEHGDALDGPLWDME